MVYDAVATTADSASQLCFCDTLETVCLAFPAIALYFRSLYLHVSNQSVRTRFGDRTNDWNFFAYNSRETQTRERPAEDCS